MSLRTSCLENGAKKTTHCAYLDITHYAILTKEQELAIENQVNKIIPAKKISKSFMDKAEAKINMDSNCFKEEVVNIYVTDVEACCGTHIDSKSEVGWVRILKTQKLQDGIVKLYYVAGVNQRDLELGIQLINLLTKMFSIPENNYLKKIRKYFKTSNILRISIWHQKLNQFNHKSNLCCQVLKQNATAYFNEFGLYVPQLKEKGSRLIFLANNYEALNLMLAAIQEQCNPLNQLNKTRLIKDGKKSIQVTDIYINILVDGKDKQKKGNSIFEGIRFLVILYIIKNKKKQIFFQLILFFILFYILHRIYFYCFHNFFLLIIFLHLYFLKYIIPRLQRLNDREIILKQI